MSRYFFLAVLMLAGLVSRSQAPVAEFSASVTEGCAPLTVKFTDNSTGDPKFWDWDLGNGQLSNQQNPSVVYSVPGKYTVKLVVRNSDGLNGITKTEYITVLTPPTASFTSDLTTVCLPGVIQFRDLSVANVGTLNSWEWDFGDGSKSTQQNPVKAYATQGFYSVTLTVASNSGCGNYTTRFRFIRVLSGVKAAFIDSVAKVCKTPFDVTYLNQTSGPGNLSYSWDLGNGTTSTAKNPLATINSPGSYNVKLIARSDLGCSDTSAQAVTLSNTNTSFTASDSTCLNSPVAFKNGTDTALSTRWDFGDGTGSLLVNPSKTFVLPGTYQVKLVNVYGSCTDSITKSIKVLANPAVDFTSASQGACKAPYAASFQDTSPDAVSWQWNFGDGSSSTQQNPSHTYTTAGEFDVSLTIQTRAGCKNTITKTKWIRIAPPTVSFANAPAGGCIPFTFSPTASINAPDGVTSYLWDFGDGVTSTSPNPAHTYSNAGNYTLKLSITTGGGCTASVTLPNGVRTGTKPVPDFTASDDSVCVKSAVNFTDLSTPVPGVDQWLWSFGDTATSTLKNPSHQYADTGGYTVKLTAFNNGCDASITKTRFVYVLPPVANFYDSVACSDKLRAFFINKSVVNPLFDPTTYLWEFGDPGNSTSTSAQPNFQYPAFGTYTVKLTVSNKTGCSNTFIKQVSLLNELADFTVSKATVCNNEVFTLSAVSSNPANVVQYAWSVNGGTPVIGGRNFQTSLPSNGTYNITLTITDQYGCPDTKTKNGIVTVTGPTANFGSSITGGCKNSVATFTDASIPVGGINKWTFNFGDGTVQSYTAPPFSHQYKDTGNFSVQLTVQDGTGCTNSLTLPTPIKISKPIVAFTTNAALVCPGVPVQFSDSSKTYGQSGYLWNFGDGSTSTLQNPSHIYTGANNTYSVSLIVQDSLGCSDSLTKTNFITVRAPKAAFDAVDTTSICLPLETKFFNKSQDYESLYWSFGDGNTSNLDTTSNFYNGYGTFRVKLFAIGEGGCTDSSESTVTLYDPFLTTSINYKTVVECNSATVDFVITRPPFTDYTFYFGDGSTNNSHLDTLQHFYASPNSYFPSIYVSDSVGCLAGIGGPKPIVILGASPFYSTDKNAFCDSGTVFFTNFTLGNDPVISSIWDFGDGNTSLETNPIHNYTTPGQFISSLSIKTQNGCASTLTDTIRIYPTPVPAIKSDSLSCINSEIQFDAALALPDSLVTWNWNLGNGQTSTQQNPKLVYDKAGPYTISLEATNLLGCKGSTTKNIVVTPLPLINIVQEPVIPVGSGITIPVTYSPNIQTYNWAPPAALTCTTCPNPIANPTKTTTYTVTVTDSVGCSSSKEVTVKVVCNDKNYFVPNTFTPNGDGVNDFFFPRGNNINRVQSMRIFNRWGEMIFEKRNFAANSQADGWNGTYKGQAAASDAYVYVVEFICENGSIIPFKGNVTLIR